MRALAFLALLFLMPVLALADVRWRKFDVSDGRKETIALGHAVVTVELQKVQTSGFPDDLLMTMKTPGQKPKQFYFTSTYYGAIAIHGNLLLLKIWRWQGYSGTSRPCQGVAIGRGLRRVGEYAELVLCADRSPQCYARFV